MDASGLAATLFAIKLVFLCLIGLVSAQSALDWGPLDLSLCVNYARELPCGPGDSFLDQYFHQDVCFFTLSIPMRCVYHDGNDCGFGFDNT